MEDDLRSPRKRPDIDYCTELQPEDLLQRIENLENGQEKKDAEIKDLNEKIEKLMELWNLLLVSKSTTEYDLLGSIVRR